MAISGHGSGVWGRFFRWPDVGPQLIEGHEAIALKMELAHQPTIKTLPHAQGLSQVSDGSSGALGVLRLVSRAQRREVGSKGVHASEITIW